MNCESLQTLLDHSDLNAISDSYRRAVQSHVESCAECAAAFAVHEEFLAMRVPSVPADLENRCFESIASSPDRRVGRRRTGPVVLGSLVIAAAAAMVGTAWLTADDDADVAAESQRLDSPSEQSSADPDTAPGDSNRDPSVAGNRDGAATPSTAASTDVGPFTVELTRLVPVGQPRMSQLFGDWFHAALVEELGRVPNLVLIEAAGDIEVPSIPDDPSTAEFSFDRDTTTWPGDYDFRLAAGAGMGDDWAGQRYTVVSAEGRYWSSSSSSDAMRPSVEASPDYAAVLAAEVVEALRLRLFPADAASLASQFARYEAIVADTTAEHAQRIRALAAAGELARRTDDVDITARLVDATLALAEQIENALLNSSMFARIASRIPETELRAVRTQFADAPAGILDELRGIGDVRVIGPMSEALLYDRNEEVRRVAASILGEFVDDAVARAALESAAAFDASAEVRETADNYLLDDAVHIEGLFSVVRDSSLSDQERLRPLVYADRSQFIDPGFSLDQETVDLLADLIERNDAAWRHDVLYGLSVYRSPSFVPIFLERLRNDPSPDVRALIPGILREHRSQAGVEAALEAAVTDDPSGYVRAEAARILDDVIP